ncbi:hypothetical protein Misp04_58330 [Micromonospora sp. NBRC 101691]|nr:hypothetical protein Misp04_58330 [Micromonospora sp. NBRC 101691]
MRYGTDLRDPVRMPFRRCRHRSRVGDAAANHQPSPEVTSSNLRRGGRLGSTRQGHALAAGMLVLAGVLPACGGPADPSERTAEAEASAREVADQIVTDLRTPTVVRTRTADDIGRTLTARSDASLVAVSGVDTAHPDGVTAVLLVTGSGTDGAWLEPEWVTEDYCFALRFTATSVTSPRIVPCPSPTVRPTFPPAPEPKVPSLGELRAALATTTPDEPAVRAALARLPLDPTVRVDVTAQDAVVGVALRHPAGGSGGYGCLLARVRAGAVEVWQPSEVQLVPGELACRATESLAGHGRQPPS